MFLNGAFGAVFWRLAPWNLEIDPPPRAKIVQVSPLVEKILESERGVGKYHGHPE